MRHSGTTTYTMKELRAKAGDIIRTVANSRQEVTVTNNGTEMAVIMSIADYERLTDFLEALRRKDYEQRASEPAMSLSELLDQFGVGPSELAAP